MTKKLTVVLLVVTSYVPLCIAGDISSFAKSHNSSRDNAVGKSEIPTITNEAQYAEWLKKREQTKQSSSALSSQSTTSTQATRVVSSSAKKAVK